MFALPPTPARKRYHYTSTTFSNIRADNNEKSAYFESEKTS